MDDNANHKLLSVDALITLASSGTLTEGQLKSLIEKVASLPPADRTGFWCGLRDEIDAPLYGELHGFYVEWCLSHSWKKRGKEFP